MHMGASITRRNGASLRTPPVRYNNSAVNASLVLYTPGQHNLTHRRVKQMRVCVHHVGREGAMRNGGGWGRGAVVYFYHAHVEVKEWWFNEAQ